MFRNIPPITKNLLLINITLYVVSMVLLNSGIDLFHLLSARYFNSLFFEPYTIVTHMFMHSHSDIFHLIFNMFLLFMFGSHLERVWGSKRFFIFYIASGLGAFLLYNGIGVYQIYSLKQEILASNIFQGTEFSGLEEFHVRMMDNADIGKIFVSTDMPPTLGAYHDLNVSRLLGASGAIFGLLAGFAILFPNTELMLLFPPIPIKAKYLIGAYMAYEVYNSIYASGDSIAHLAHVGGAVVGGILVLIWRKKDRSNFY